MKPLARRIIGAVMFFGTLMGIVVATATQVGVLETAKGLGFSIILTAIVVVGAHLLVDD